MTSCAVRVLIYLKINKIIFITFKVSNDQVHLQIYAKDLHIILLNLCSPSNLNVFNVHGRKQASAAMTEVMTAAGMPDRFKNYKKKKNNNVNDKQSK